MPVPRWLDRIWLTLIGLSAALMLITWTYSWGERYGYTPVAVFIAVFLVSLRFRK